ncbi:hypothetical protein CBR_g54166 [Chara braunii]|uniref:Uncharacterized protein n=1 Tax=Chara braunii TaxID=69332 RepID=A0A388K740_CHABU|nr:hypothetical protein CBR_g54166 [Chara braunii]|eukprot:GBG65874.1 hypothetical protein CBR_g54166 [Chara braunii]
MDSLEGAVALVAGGAGTVGSAIVKGFLDAGAVVIVPSRSKDRNDGLRTQLGNPAGLHTVEADICTDAGLQTTLSYVDDELGGKLDHVVSSLGGGVWGVPVLGDKPLSFFMQTIVDLCGSHYAIANATLKRIADKSGSSYLFVSGMLANAYMKGAGFVTIAASGLAGLSLVVRGETSDKAVRVNELRIGLMVARDTPLSYDIGKIAAGIAKSGKKGEVVQVCSDADIANLKAALHV